MNTKIDHEAYIRDIADKLRGDITRVLETVSKNCVTCEFFDDIKEFCNIHKARPPAHIIVKGCADYANEIPF